jgi:hypothetical protein
MLIDCAKTYGRDNDKPLQRAIKRMEERLELLQYRRAVRQKNARSRAWHWYQYKRYGHGRPIAEVPCPYCKFGICFGDFIRTVELRGASCDIVRFDCPSCETLLMYDNEPTSDCKFPESIPASAKIPGRHGNDTGHAPELHELKKPDARGSRQHAKG